jgi:hypothetical protein
MTGCGGIAFSLAFRRILRSSEIPTRSQHPTCPSGIGTSVVNDGIFTGGGDWIEPRGILLSGCGAFTLAGGDLWWVVAECELVRNPRRMMAGGMRVG